MSKCKAALYPKVFKSNLRQSVFVNIPNRELESSAIVEIKIQAMEQYSIKHSAIYRIDEEDRYPFLTMEKCGKNLYVLEYDFTEEQKYSVTVKLNGKELAKTYLYAVDGDLAALGVYKGDTHLHTNRSDGRESPAEIGCCYRRAGFDFIAITDHHKMSPSVEAKEIFEKLTDMFTVFKGEEIHNRDTGYFHIVNLGGDISVNDIVENQPDFVDSEIEKIISSHSFPENAEAYNCAYRIFVAEQIRRGGGVAIMAHPYWTSFGEYNMQTADIRYLWKNQCFDALEVLAGCDHVDNGNNLQAALWADLRAEGAVIPVVGGSDCHNTKSEFSRFNKQFTLVFANGTEDIKNAIKEERAVAVKRHSETDFFVFGRFRMVKYARFLMNEYYPSYEKLAAKHAELLEAAIEGDDVSDKLRIAEEEIREFKRRFFAF